MYEVSQSFLEAIQQPNREIRAKLDIPGLLTIENTNIISFKMDEGIIPGDEFEIGGTVASTFEMKINNHDKTFSNYSFANFEAELYIGILTGDCVFAGERGRFEYVSMGRFMIEYASKPTDDVITIQGIDFMYKFEKPYITNLNYPTALSNVLIEICNQAGVTLKGSNINNGGFIVDQKPDTSNMTLRQALGYVAEASGGFARITRNGMAEIAWYTPSYLNIDSNVYYSLNIKDDVQLIDKLIIKYDDLDMAVGTGKNVYTIGNNPFLMLDTSKDYSAIYNMLNTLYYYPLEMSWGGNPALQAGDMIDVTDMNGNVFQTLITSNNITFGAGLKYLTKADGKSKTAKNYRSKGTIAEQVKTTKSKVQILNNRIAFVITQDGKILPASIEASINGSEAKIVLKADKILFDTDGTGQGKGIVSIAEGVLTADAIKALNLTVGNQIQMGSGTVITWANLSTETQQNLKGPTGATGATGPQGPPGPSGSDAQVPDWVTQTIISGGFVTSPLFQGNAFYTSADHNNWLILSGGTIQFMHKNIDNTVVEVFKFTIDPANEGKPQLFLANGCSIDTFEGSLRMRVSDTRYLRVNVGGGIDYVDGSTEIHLDKLGTSGNVVPVFE